MARQYGTHTKFTRVSNAEAAATTDINSTGVDMVGYESVLFAVHFGTITAGAVTSVKAQQGADNSSDWEDLEGTAITVADDDDNGIVLLEIVKPQDRYVRCVVDRGTQNAVVDAITALQYNTRKQPVTQPASVVGHEAHYSPDEGTA